MAKTGPFVIDMCILSIPLYRAVVCLENYNRCQKQPPQPHFAVRVLAGKAVKLLELAVDLDDSNVQAHIQLLTILARDENYRHRAPTEMQQALKNFPNNVHIQHLCASFLLECGQDDAAEALLSRLANLRPKNGLVASTQGLLHMKRGQREAAASCFKRGMADTMSQNALLCHEELAKLAVLEGRPEVARDVFQHGAGRFQPNSRFLREWGLFERKMGNVDQARTLFQQSVELRAMDVRSWVAWALLERSQEDYTQALEVLRQVRITLKYSALFMLCSMLCYALYSAAIAPPMLHCSTLAGSVAYTYACLLPAILPPPPPLRAPLNGVSCALQAISVAPKVTTLWFLYCETALKVLPLGKCRAIFEEAHKCIPR